MNIIKSREELSLGKTIYDMNLRVVYYARVSTEKDEQLNSLYNQSQYFEDLINDAKNWTFVNSYIDEGISGTGVNNRKSFLRMIEDGSAGLFDLVLTKEVSRFARNTVDSIKYTQFLLTKGVIVNFISDNINTIYPDSEFRLTLMASLAQDEVRKLSERVKFGMKRSVKDGRLLGGGNITGYKKLNCKLTIDEEESKMVEMIFDLYASGKYGFRIISQKLAEKGYFNTVGKPHNENTLKRIIQNPRYKGFYTANQSYVEDYKTHKKVRIPKSEWICYKDDNIPAIVSEEVWDKANKILDERVKKTNSNILNKEWFLENKKYTSKLICLEHNTTFIKKGCGRYTRSPVWVCNEYLRRGLKGCASPIISEEDLDTIFLRLLDGFVNNKKALLENMINDYKMVILNVNKKEDLDVLVNKINYKEKMKDKLLELVTSGDIPNNEFKQKNDKINDELLILKQELIEKQNIRVSVNYYEKQIEKIKKSLEPKLNIKDNFNYLLDLLVDKVYISKVNNDRNHIKMQVIYKLDKADEVIELDISKKNRKDGKRESLSNEDIKKNKEFLLSDTNR
ncbi:MAG: recombinase family protein, partial [bacterium]|nr:recombinase family protein [bacterium]